MKDFKLRGKTIRHIRMLHGLSATKLGELADIDRNFLTQIEREIRTMSYKNHFRILRALRELGVSDSHVIAITLLIEDYERQQKEEQQQ
ncbi:helix-turn-helix transcriptional regulator [Bacillus sp. RO1]|uniref:helix-turn-helix domain-containing protein n=1 Tax=Bacillus sp. RO1 TaxID=2722703 RepID=UPI001456413C|nr:helix-turn-helix transcriptional regulator [Bacillus sp. RO1]NLP51283.1 helix-turn-helix transcriptional regulator [Bacillus sp. RO1]